MSQQATFSSEQFRSITQLDSISRYFKSLDGDAYTYKVRIALDREAQTRVTEWNLNSPNEEVDRTTELVNHLNADSDAVLSAILEHTDLRTTKIGSHLGSVIVDTGGDIVGYKLIKHYPNAPSVQITHEDLVEDLRALNPE